MKGYTPLVNDDRLLNSIGPSKTSTLWKSTIYVVIICCVAAAIILPLTLIRDSNTPTPLSPLVPLLPPPPAIVPPMLINISGECLVYNNIDACREFSLRKGKHTLRVPRLHGCAHADIEQIVHEMEECYYNNYSNGVVFSGTQLASLLPTGCVYWEDKTTHTGSGYIWVEGGGVPCGSSFGPYTLDCVQSCDVPHIPTCTQCNQYGTCDATGECICRGNRNSTDGCATCIKHHYGSECDFCDPATTCSGNGTCNLYTSGCICNSHFSGHDCASCAPGWSGEACETLENTFSNATFLGKGDCTVNSNGNCVKFGFYTCNYGEECVIEGTRTVIQGSTTIAQEGPCDCNECSGCKMSSCVGSNGPGMCGVESHKYAHGNVTPPSGAVCNSGGYLVDSHGCVIGCEIWMSAISACVVNMFTSMSSFDTFPVVFDRVPVGTVWDSFLHAQIFYVNLTVKQFGCMGTNSSLCANYMTAPAICDTISGCAWTGQEPSRYSTCIPFTCCNPCGAEAIDRVRALTSAGYDVSISACSAIKICDYQCSSNEVCRGNPSWPYPPQNCVSEVVAGNCIPNCQEPNGGTNTSIVVVTQQSEYDGEACPIPVVQPCSNTSGCPEHGNYMETCTECMVGGAPNAWTPWIRCTYVCVPASATCVSLPPPSYFKACDLPSGSWTMLPSTFAYGQLTRFDGSVMQAVQKCVQESCCTAISGNSNSENRVWYLSYYRGSFYPTTSSSGTIVTYEKPNLYSSKIGHSCDWGCTGNSPTPTCYSPQGLTSTSTHCESELWSESTCLNAGCCESGHHYCSSNAVTQCPGYSGECTAPGTQTCSGSGTGGCVASEGCCNRGLIDGVWANIHNPEGKVYCSSCYPQCKTYAPPYSMYSGCTCPDA